MNRLAQAMDAPAPSPLATVALAMALGLPGAARADTDRATLLGLSGSILKVEALRVQGGFSLGTGVVIAPQRVVTSCHVTHDAVRINVLRGGLRWAVVAQRSDVERDLCLLRVPALEAAAVALAPADRLQPGAPVVAVGYTGGLHLQHSDGEVVALHRYDGARVVQSSNAFSSGASGGGLFDARSQLVGILTFRLRGGAEHYFSAPVDWLQQLLAATDAGNAGEGEREVAPERSPRLPYWQRSAPDQPRFLAAAQLLQDDHWPELASLSDTWLRSDASDPEPWFLMGTALAALKRVPAARHALECALALEPTSAIAKASLEALALAQDPNDADPPAPRDRAACDVATASGQPPR